MPPLTPVVLGVELAVRASWYARCHVDDWTDDDGHDTDCNGQEFTFDLTCAGLPCEIVDGEHGDDTSWTKYITLLDSGRLALDATITHEAETLSGTARIDVMQPDGFGTMCYYGSADDPDCNETTVDANYSPWVIVFATLGEEKFKSRLLRVNDREPFVYTADGPLIVDLAQLYPQVAVEGRVPPGRYELRISLGDRTEIHTIDAR